MLVAVINAKNYEEAKQQIDAIAGKADAIELRLDYWQPLDLNLLRKLCENISLMTIFTLRHPAQGGNFKSPEEERLQWIEKLCELNPDYFDFEYDISTEFLKKINKLFPKIKIISSYHDFSKMPKELEQLLASMKRPEIYCYKIAVTPNSALDALNLLAFLKDNNKERLTIIGMGESGASTRILGKIYGNHFTFASISSELKTAAGQLTVDTLTHDYFFREINAETKIIVQLAEKSKAFTDPVFYNQYFKEKHKNVVCVGMLVQGKELKDILQIAKNLSIIFLNKLPANKIIPLLDKIDAFVEKTRHLTSSKTLIIYG